MIWVRLILPCNRQPSKSPSNKCALFLRTQYYLIHMCQNYTLKCLSTIYTSSIFNRLVISQKISWIGHKRAHSGLRSKNCKKKRKSNSKIQPRTYLTKSILSSTRVMIVLVMRNQRKSARRVFTIMMIISKRNQAFRASSVYKYLFRLDKNQRVEVSWRWSRLVINSSFMVAQQPMSTMISGVLILPRMNGK